MTIVYSGDQPCNVKNFGAVGNGYAEDTNAIQNAINSLGSEGGVVYFPQGIYLTDTLYIPSNVTLFGYDKESTTLQLVNYPSGALLECSGTSSSDVHENIRVENLSLKHDVYYNKQNEQKGILIRGYFTRYCSVYNCILYGCSVYGILLSQIDANNTYARSWVISGNRFTNFTPTSKGIFLYDQAEYVMIKENTFEEMGQAIQSDNSANCEIHDNTFLQCGDKASASPVINISGNSGSINSGKALIHDNQINHSKYMPLRIYQGGSRNSQYGSIVHHNFILIDEGFSNNPVAIYGMCGGIIQDNHISSGSANKVPCIYLSDAGNVTASDNNIHDNIFSWAGINTNNCSGSNNMHDNSVVQYEQ